MDRKSFEATLIFLKFKPYINTNCWELRNKDLILCILISTKETDLMYFSIVYKHKNIVLHSYEEMLEFLTRVI